MEPPVPSTIDQFTADWLTTALVHGGLHDAVVADFSSEPVGDGKGFIGELHRLRVTYEPGSSPDAPASMVAKLPTSEAGGRSIGSQMRMYQNEAGFYRHLAKDCPIPIPRCFYNGEDEASSNWCLLIEDLGHLSPGDQLVPRTLEELTGDLSRLAALHGAWADRRGDSHQWLPRLADSAMVGVLDAVEPLYPAAMEHLADIVPGHMHDWPLRFAPDARAWVADFNDQPNTILHGDYRTDNFMHGPDGAVTTIDWQLCCRAPGAYDVFYFLSQCAEPEVVLPNLELLVGHYLDEMGEASHAPAPELFFEQMRGVALWLMCLGIVVAASLNPATERDRHLFVAQRRRGSALADALDSSQLLR